MTELFYNFLAAGKTKDVALQQAKLEFLKTHSKEKQDPIFWAATVLIGDAAAMQNSSNYFYYFAGGFILSAVLFWGLKTKNWHNLLFDSPKNHFKKA